LATLNNLPEMQPQTTQQQAPEKAHEPEIKAIPKTQSFAHRTVLTVYRIFAILALYAVLIGIVSYAFIMGFYAVNTTWAAPVILSDSDEKSLDFLEKLVTSRQTLEDLKVDVTRQQSSLSEMTKHRGSLIALDPELQHAIDRERAHDRVVGPELVALDSQKLKDNVTTQQVLQELEQTEAQIRKDLAAGLITKADADTQLAALNQSRDAYTDSKIAEVLLTDTVLDKTTRGTKSLDVLEKQAELRSEIAQIDVAINIAAKQLEEDNRQVERLHDAIATAKQSPYYLNANGSKRLYFGFVPYDNQAYATIGAPIYDCYLNMILCRKVGAVKQIFLGEQTIMHPIFKTQVRGLTIQMDLSHPESAKSKTVFLGHKPLLF
jgi:hypothetical protein